MRYSGHLGIVEETEVRPGVWEETVTEIPVLGTVDQRTETVVGDDEIIPRSRTTTTVSVFVRGLGQVDNSNIRYLSYAGKNWTVTSDMSRFPRLKLYIGETYNGPTPD